MRALCDRPQRWKSWTRYEISDLVTLLALHRSDRSIAFRKFNEIVSQGGCCERPQSSCCSRTDLPWVPQYPNRVVSEQYHSVKYKEGYEKCARKLRAQMKRKDPGDASAPSHAPSAQAPRPAPRPIASSSRVRVDREDEIA